jgi:membrane-bound lytic murein transglycosylase D
MRLKVLFFTIFCAILQAYGSIENDTIILKTDIETEKITRDLDSLVNSWFVKMALEELPEDFVGDSVGIEFPDSVYIERLSKIHSIINLRYNSIIRNHIHVYTVKQRDKFSVVLGFKDYYFPIIEDIFDSYGLPTELKYMAVIESALNTNAVSPKGATGLWQFMYSTGRFYGLTINSVVDERRDPVRSTHAAAKYLRDLYDIYNDWVLVIAAYNCGPGNVNKAIRRSGNRKDYWEIYYRLPRETRGYIPQYVAATYAVNYFADHNIRPLPLNFPVATDTILFNKDIHLTQISEVMGIPSGELRALNSQYRTGLVPGASRPTAITLPISYIGDFIEMNDTIRSYKEDVYLSKTIRISDPTRSTYVPANIKGKTRLVYSVKEGDNLGYIAEWYGIGLSQLRYWNNIYRNKILIGQKLVVYVDPSKADYYAQVNSMSFADKQNMIGKTVPSNTENRSTAQATQSVEDEEYITYTVRYGDTIWDIVKMFDNVTTTDVLKLNNISDPGKIQVGQILKIRKKS